MVRKSEVPLFAAKGVKSFLKLAVLFLLLPALGAARA